MAQKDDRPTGLTKDVGFQIGVRRTLPIPFEEAWQFLTSEEGVALWLGETAEFDFGEGGSYQLADGAHGEIRVFKPNSHLRLTWQPGDWPRPSTIQLRVVPNGERTTIAFHQEHLPGAEEREERRAYYKAVLARIKEVIGP